ncbi:MAG: tRNA (N(6)-L-threonylcarbamoyladenosine(37)-C(2))-methylthiotransferase MtaB [Acutalibacteraceae bacterium]|nr:tRNA (N(6)-L-threonylcarbamoyladenosine(37)-C(2))-methylthiotransferase MtaB [Acutalibacteraceae bacterium]
MKFYIFTLGCKVNQYESQIMHENLINSGFEYTKEYNNADIIIINSCTVTSASDSKAVKLMHRVKRENPQSVLVLTGCLPQAFPDDERFIEADIILGNKSRSILVSTIQQYLTNRVRIINVSKHETGDDFESMSISNFTERTRAFVKIEDGCNRFCSYCIIPYARGRVRSKPLEELKAEIEALSRKGFKEVVLVGINLSAYGQEFNMDLSDAIETACAVEGIERVRLGSLEPERMDEATIARISKQPKLCPQFHLSLQSGCDATLKRMNRHYNTAEYYEIVQNLRKAFENCAITTDIMVGFPGETDEEFNESLGFAEKVAFAKVHTFAYSRRPGTVADKAENQVAESIKNIRSKEMIELTTKTQEEFLQLQIGRTEPVLFEREKNGYYEGHTMNYTQVIVKSDKDISNQILNVKITDVDKNRCVGALEN